MGVLRGLLGVRTKAAHIEAHVFRDWGVALGL